MKELTTAQLAVLARMTLVINRYTGWHVRPREVEVFEDPSVSGVYAIQVTRREGPHQFLYHSEMGEDGVEEVVFTSWPPTTMKGR